MKLFVLLVLVLLVGFAAAAVTGRLGPGLDEATSTQASAGLPDVAPGELDPRVVDEVRFDQALRGYRMDQVDAALERLTAELRLRDERLAELRAELAPGSTAPDMDSDGYAAPDSFVAAPMAPTPAGQD